MVYYLVWIQVVVVDIVLFGGPFEIEERGPDIVILNPSSLEKTFAKVLVPSFDDEYFVVLADTILSFPT